MTAGTDPHKHVHVAVAVNAAGRPVGKPLTFKNGALQLTAPLTRIRAIAGGEPVTRAIEDGRGLARRLADGLLLAGQEVAWVPTRLTAAHRRLHAAAGSKPGPADAAAAARAAMAMPGLDRHRIDDRVRELRALVDYRDDIVKRRTMAINQLKAQAHLWLGHAPGDLTRAKALSELTALAGGAPLGRHVRQVLAAMAEEIAGLNQRVRDLDAAIRDLVTPLACGGWATGPG